MTIDARKRVARMERSEIRVSAATLAPGFALLNPGYCSAENVARAPQRAAPSLVDRNGPLHAVVGIVLLSRGIRRIILSFRCRYRLVQGREIGVLPLHGGGCGVGRILLGSRTNSIGR